VIKAQETNARKRGDQQLVKSRVIDILIRVACFSHASNIVSLTHLLPSVIYNWQALNNCLSAVNHAYKMRLVAMSVNKGMNGIDIMPIDRSKVLANIPAEI